MKTNSQLSDQATFAGFKAAFKHQPRVPALCSGFTGLTAMLQSADVTEALGSKWMEGFDRGQRVLREEHSGHALFIHDQYVAKEQRSSVMELHPAYFQLAREESDRACGDAYFVDVRAMVSGL